MCQKDLCHHDPDGRRKLLKIGNLRPGAALRRLPAEQRTALALYYLAGMPVAAVAAETGVPVGTVKARLSRGRTALAALLTADATEVAGA